MYKILIMTGVLAYSTTVLSSNCIDSKTRLNVCVMGEEMATLLRPELPKQLTQTMYLESISSLLNTVTFRAVLQYDKNHLATVYKEKGVTLSYGKEVLSNSAHGMCHVPEMKEYIDAGGIVVYNYVFQDYQLFTQVRVTAESCKKRG